MTNCIYLIRYFTNEDIFSMAFNDITLDMILWPTIHDLQNWFRTNTKQIFAVSFYCHSCREYLRHTNRDKKVYSCIAYFLWIRIACRPKALIYWIGVANNCNRERYVYTYIMLLVEQFIKHAKNFDGKKHANLLLKRYIIWCIQRSKY